MAELIYAGDGGAFKICGTCREIKSLREFACKKSTIDGLRNACKECENSPRRKDGLAVGDSMPCFRCGKTILKTAPGKKFCESCIKQIASEKGARIYAASSRRAENPIGSTIQCIDCGTDIVRTGSKVSRCTDCYKFIRDNRHYLEQGKEPNHKPKGATIPCAFCGSQFERRAHNSKYCCEDCYREASAASRKACRDRHNEKRKRDPHYLISCRMSAGMRSSLKCGKDGYHWETLVSYTRATLASHLERQFLPGMSWENMEEWDIDHIVPKSSFKYETYRCDEFQAAWALTNLRPLWSTDNRKKHAKLVYMI